MIQVNQIGKYRKKDSVLEAKRGETFVTPENREYIFDYRKEGRKYIFTLTYRGQKIQVSETDYNTTPMDTILKTIDNELKAKP